MYRYSRENEFEWGKKKNRPTEFKIAEARFFEYENPVENRTGNATCAVLVSEESKIYVYRANMLLNLNDFKVGNMVYAKRTGEIEEHEGIFHTVIDQVKIRTFDVPPKGPKGVRASTCNHGEVFFSREDGKTSVFETNPVHEKRLPYTLDVELGICKLLDCQVEFLLSNPLLEDGSGNLYWNKPTPPCFIGVEIYKNAEELIEGVKNRVFEFWFDEDTGYFYLDECAFQAVYFEDNVLFFVQFDFSDNEFYYDAYCKRISKFGSIERVKPHELWFVEEWTKNFEETLLSHIYGSDGSWFVEGEPSDIYVLDNSNVS